VKIKELAERIKKVNPEAEFEVIVLNYPQKFSLSFGGGDGGTVENCDSWGPIVDEVEHYSTGPNDPFPEGVTKGAGSEASGNEAAEAPAEDKLQAEPDFFRDLIGKTLDQAKEILDENGFTDYEFEPETFSLEVRFLTRGEWPSPWISHIVRIECRRR
jgi:hypothetical protein